MKNKSHILEFIIERFPLHILTFTTLSSIMASATVSTESFSAWQIVAAFTIITLFLFHIRAIDERRDFANDSALHPNRPVQRGVVSVKQLLSISISGIILSLIIAANASMPTLIIALLFVAYTSLAAFDFFAPSFFKDRPVLYHIVNSPQMILSQWLIFSIFTKSFAINENMLLFMILIYNNIFILEIVRKVKNPEAESSDSYTAHLGLKKSSLFLISLVVSGLTIFVFIIKNIADIQSIATVGGITLGSLVIALVLNFYIVNSRRNQKLMELSTVLFYVLLNFIIYFAG